VTGELFKENGIEIYGESHLNELLEKLREDESK